MYVILSLIGLMFLGYILMGLTSILVKRKNYGPIVLGGLFTSNVYRKKDSIKFPYNLKKIDMFFRNELQLLDKFFFDLDILDNLICVIEEDLHLKGIAPVKAFGCAYSRHIFRNLFTFKKKYVIFIDARVLYDYRMIEAHIGELIAHEYLHHLLYKKYRNSDPHHHRPIWDILYKKRFGFDFRRDIKKL